MRDFEKFQPVIKWTGSKRSQAFAIIKEIPSFNTYFEPFLGGGSMMYAIAPQKGVCGDICSPLIDLWILIQKDYIKVYYEYGLRWNELQKNGHSYYYEIRNRFNKTKCPYDFLFLTRTCVNGLIRFNKKGEFNSSFHHTRNGINPERLKTILEKWSNKIQNVEFVNKNYYETTVEAKKDDFIYLDPPYFNTSGVYFGNIDFDNFINYLIDLNNRNIKWGLSYDGIRGENDFIANVPKEIYKRHLMIPSGLSGFNKVLNNKLEQVHESLYLNY